VAAERPATTPIAYTAESEMPSAASQLFRRSGSREDRRARDQVGYEEKADLECVPADVADSA
jgi:hypothetical protein